MISADRPRVLVLDVDSTLVDGEVIEMLAAHAGALDEVAAVTESAMRGELDFAASLHARVALLAGLPVSVLGTVLAGIRLNPGAVELVEAVQRAGWRIGLVSGGFLEVVEPLAARLGIDFVRANRLEVEGGHLTGRVTGAVIDRAAKAAALRELAAAHGAAMADSVAIGDGANDLDMIDAAGLGIAFNAKPVVAARAAAAIHGRLDAALPLLGLPGGPED
ncbi:phosphoserine phosphatase SerB [Actinotalea sp.]|uniref:phosphoserine phosphatase SerB n=1 Tax=Actinotalea sp. TaxID=1872145 RepID=UPI0035629468